MRFEPEHDSVSLFPDALQRFEFFTFFNASGIMNCHAADFEIDPDIRLMACWEIRKSNIPSRHINRHSPPKTSTSENRQAGDACPVHTIWFGSPFPQLVSPKTLYELLSPTIFRFRQKLAEMPRQFGFFTTWASSPFLMSLPYSQPNWNLCGS